MKTAKQKAEEIVKLREELTVNMMKKENEKLASFESLVTDFISQMIDDNTSSFVKGVNIELSLPIKDDEVELDFSDEECEFIPFFQEFPTINRTWKFEKFVESILRINEYVFSIKVNREKGIISILIEDPTCSI